MAKPWMRRFGLVLLLLLLAGSVALWLVSRVEVPTVTVRQVSIQIPVNNRARVQLQVAVSNTLGVPLSYLGADYKVAVGELVLVQGKVDLRGAVAAGAETNLLLPLTVDLARLKEARVAAGRGAKAIISGGLHVYLGQRKETIPFVYKKRLAFGGAGVTSRVTSAHVDLLEQGRVRLKAVLEVQNPLGEALRSPGSDYRVLLDKKEVARGSLKTRVEIPAGGKGPVDLSVNVALPRLGTGAPPPRTMTILATIRASVGGRPVRIPLRLHKELSGLPGAQSCTPREVSVKANDDGSLAVQLSLGCRGDFAAKVSSATVQFSALLDGAEVASGTVTAQKTARDKEGLLVVQVPLTVRLDRLRKVRAAAAGGPSSLAVKGLVIARLKDGHLRLPFELTKKFTPGGLRCQLVELSVSRRGGKLRLGPRLRITGPGPLPVVDSMEATYTVTVAGLDLGSGAARLTGHGDKKQILARAELVLDLAGLKALKKETGPLELRVAGQVHIRANGKIRKVSYAFTRTLQPGRQAMSVSLLSLRVQSPDKDRLVLVARLGVHSQLEQTLRNISASFTAQVQDQKLLQGTFRLPALGGGRAGNARLRLVLDPARLRALQSRAVGRRLVLLLRGVLTASLPGQKQPLRVPFVTTKSIRLAQESMSVTVESVKVHRICRQGLEATIRLGLEGKAARKLGKLHAAYEVLANKQTLAKGELVLRATSPTRWTAELPLAINTTSLAALRESGAEVAQVIIRGRVTGGPGGRTRMVIPFTVTRQVHLGRQRPLDVSIKTVVLDATSPGKLKVNLLLALRSRLKVDLQDLDASYTVTAAGKSVLRGSFMLKRLEAGGAGEARIPMTIKTAALAALKGGAGAGSLLITGKVKGKIVPRGARPRSFSVPFTIRKAMSPGGKPLRVDVEGVWIKEISAAQVKLLVKLRLGGGALEGARDLRASFKVKAQGEQILTGELKLRSTGGGKGALVLACSAGSGMKQQCAVAELPLTVKSARLRAIKKKSKGKKTDLEISGVVTASTAQGVLKIPFVVHKQATLMDRPLAVKLHKLDFSGMSLRNRTFRAVLELTNRAPFTIKNLNIEGTFVLGRGVKGRVLNRNVTIKPGETTRLTMAVKAERSGILRLLAQKIRGKRARSRMKLKMSGKTPDGATITTSAEQSETVPVGK